MDRGEAHGHLRLDRHHPDDLQVLGTLDRVVEQRRLPHSGLASEDQRPAHSGPNAVEHLVERLLFRVAVNQQHPTPLSLIALCMPRKIILERGTFAKAPTSALSPNGRSRPESLCRFIPGYW